MLSEDLVRRVAFQAMSALIPTRYDSLGVEHEDCVLADRVYEEVEDLFAAAESSAQGPGPGLIERGPTPERALLASHILMLPAKREAKGLLWPRSRDWGELSELHRDPGLRCPFYGRAGAARAHGRNDRVFTLVYFQDRRSGRL